MYCIAADGILWLLFSVCQDTREENFRKLSPLPADNGYRTAVACRQLFSTFLFRNKVQKCQFGHIDEPVHLFFMLLSVQFGNDHTARPILYHAEKVADTYHSLGHLFIPFRSHLISVAGWCRAESRIAGFGGMVGGLRACPGRQGHYCVPESRPDFR